MFGQEQSSQRAFVGLLTRWFLALYIYIVFGRSFQSSFLEISGNSKRTKTGHLNTTLMEKR